MDIYSVFQLLLEYTTNIWKAILNIVVTVPDVVAKATIDGVESQNVCTGQPDSYRSLRAKNDEKTRRDVRYSNACLGALNKDTPIASKNTIPPRKDITINNERDYLPIIEVASNSEDSSGGYDTASEDIPDNESKVAIFTTSLHADTDTPNDRQINDPLANGSGLCIKNSVEDETQGGILIKGHVGNIGTRTVDETKKKSKRSKFRMVRFKFRDKTFLLKELNTEFVDPFYKLPATVLPKKKKLEVHVTHYKSLVEVHIRLVQKLFTGEYRSMFVMLNSLYEKGQSEKYRLGCLPAIDGLYAALDEATGMWHRVKVVNVPDISKSTMVTCQFLDHGDEKKLPLSSLRLLLNRKRLIIPAQSIRCLLHGHEKLSKLSTLQKMIFSDKFLQKTSGRKLLWCQVKKRPKNQPPSIKLGAFKFENIVKDTLKAVKRVPKCQGCKQLFAVTSMLLEQSSEISQVTRCLQDSMERVNSDLRMVRTSSIDLEQGMTLYQDRLHNDMQRQFAFMARGLQIALSDYLNTDRPLELSWTHYDQQMTSQRSLSSNQEEGDRNKDLAQTWV
ncbi:uncharacterized protein LOC144442797 [Glandiceps talaboti]